MLRDFLAETNNSVKKKVGEGMARLPSVTKEDLEKCNDFNKMVMEEFLSMSNELSDKTIKQYRSGITIWINWLRLNAKNKPIHEVRSKDYAKYQSWLYNNGLSDSAIKFKRASVSTLNNHITLYYEDEYPTFKNFVTKNIKVPSTGFLNKKEPLTIEEYNNLCTKLEELEEWQKLAYVKFSYSTGCRRAEVHALRKEVVEYEPEVKVVPIENEDGTKEDVEVKIYRSHEIRCKGKGKLGVVRKMQFDEDTMDSIKKWIEIRGKDDCEFVFITENKTRGITTHINMKTFNDWCSGLFTEIVGRRVHPHIFRESRATNLVVHGGKDIEVARKLLGHVDSSTTNIYVIRDDDNDADEAFV